MFARPNRRLQRDFLEVSPGKFLKVEPGKPAKVEYTSGRVHTIGDLKRIRRLQNYWSSVNLYAETYGISVSEARRRVKRSVAVAKFDDPKANPLRYVWENLGLFVEPRYVG